MKNPKSAALALLLLLYLGACKKDPVTPIDPATLTVNPVNNITGANGDTASFKFTPLVNGALTDGATVTWTNDNTAIGLATSGTGDIAPFLLKNTGTTLAIAHIVATPSKNGMTGTPITITVQVTSAGNTFTMLNSLPLSTGAIPYHWYADAGQFVPGTVSNKWPTPTDTSALYYGIVHKNGRAGAVTTTLGYGTNYFYPTGGYAFYNYRSTDTVLIVFKVTKTDPNVTPTSLKINLIDPFLADDKAFGSNTASYGAKNDSLIVDVNNRQTIQGTFSKMDKTKPLTVYTFNTGGVNTDYYVVPFIIGKYLNVPPSASSFNIDLKLSDGTSYSYFNDRGLFLRVL